LVLLRDQPRLIGFYPAFELLRSLDSNRERCGQIFFGSSRLQNRAETTLSGERAGLAKFLTHVLTAQEDG
jgi:hypothetical protein